MPKFTHTVETEYKPSFRTESVVGMFDVPVEKRLTRTWEIDMPIEGWDWQVGLIVGPSGSGKTTIAKKVFEDARFFDGSKGFDWTPGRSFLDDFPKDIENTVLHQTLSMTGFSSPPVWCLPFDKLSNGQKFRTEMARLMFEESETIVVDEFTSVVDREVAQTCASAAQKFVRKKGKKFVAVSCHYDIIDWLEPDWVYYVDTGEFRRGRLRRPPIELTIQRVHHSAWRIFKEHHYLSADLNTSARCFVGSINGKPVAFVAALPVVHRYVSNKWRSSRTVVLPDYQGIGVGSAMSNAIGQYFWEQGIVFTGRSSHPGMNAVRAKSPHWVLASKPGMAPKVTEKGSFKTSFGRITCAFEYRGTPETFGINKDAQ